MGKALKYKRAIILGGNLSGIKTIWLDYIKIEDSATFRLKRKIENKIKKNLKRGD